LISCTLPLALLFKRFCVMLSIPFSRVPVASFVSALVLAAYSVSAMVLWSLERPGPQGHLATDVPVTTPQAVTPMPIADWPLFGTPEQQTSMGTTAASSPFANVAKSTASYQLFGVISSHNQEPRRAIIGADPSNQQMIKEGDRAPDGAIVRGIRDRDVLLERNGTLESLALPDDYLQQSDRSASPSLPPLGSSPSATTEAEELKNYLRQQREAAIARGETPIYDAPK